MNHTLNLTNRPNHCLEGGIWNEWCVAFYDFNNAPLFIWSQCFSPCLNRRKQKKWGMKKNKRKNNSIEVFFLQITPFFCSLRLSLSQCIYQIYWGKQLRLNSHDPSDVSKAVPFLFWPALFLLQNVNGCRPSSIFFAKIIFGETFFSSHQCGWIFEWGPSGTLTKQT